MSRVVSQEDIAKIAIGAMKVDSTLLYDSSCISYLIKNFLHGIKLGLKFFIPLYFIPLLLKYKDTIKDPHNIIRETIKKCVRSTLVLAAMAFLAKFAMWSYIKFFGKISPGLMTYVSASTILGLFIEAPTKLGEISVYALPRFLAAFWKFLTRRELVKNIPFGHVILFSLSTSAMAYSSKIEPENIKPLYKKFFDKFYGEN